MYLATVEYKGHGFGKIFTNVVPHTKNGVIRVQQCDLHALSTLAADVLGEEQPHQVSYANCGNLAKWIIRNGCQRYGKRIFLRQTARALAVHQTRERNGR